MQTATLEANTRENLGKNTTKQIRKAGKMPGVVYGNKTEPLHIEFEASAVEKIFRTTKNHNTLITLQVKEGEKVRELTVLPREMSKDAISQKFIHIDFFLIDIAEPIKTVVKLKFVGVSPGVKMGGNMSHNLVSLKIRSLPREVPDFIEIPLGVLELGTTFKVRDLNLGEGIEILNDGHETIVRVDALKGQEADPAKAAEAAGGKAGKKK